MIRRKQVKLTNVTVVKTAEECPAKTRQQGEQVLLGRSVYEHCAIVGAVARALIEQFPQALRSLFPPGCVALAACHDVGKLTPAFFVRLCLAAGMDSPEMHALCKEAGLRCSSRQLSEDENGWGGHPGVSFLTLSALSVPQETAWVAGAHHGCCPKAVFLCSATARALGGPDWQMQREKLVRSLEALHGEALPGKLSLYQSWLAAGLTTVADWIGSGSLFDDPDKPWDALIEPAVHSCGFSSLQVTKGQTFGDLFHSPQGDAFVPNETQEVLAAAVDGPGVYVVEAPMGLGKTEAAFFAAYQVLQKGQARGVYFALPTQLTANKIYERFVEFVSEIDRESAAPRLLHAKADDFLDRLTLETPEMSPGGAWFSYKKRGLLAPFAVGTLDQALLAVMAVRHNFVRVFGLAGKVVIIDEVHSYDAYTNGLLLQLLQLLRSLHCIVIILSATLTEKARSRLLAAAGVVPTVSYPQLSMSKLSGTVETRPLKPTEDVRVSVVLQEGDAGEERALQAAVSRAESGQQVLWIENDVASSQRIYRVLAARASDLNFECGLIHSRFTARDRSSHEEHWVTLFGKKGWEERRKGGRILVGTQILEQSLDIDADFMVSRLAVMDMVFQRAGRLWRHRQAPRPQGAKRELWLLAPALEEACKNARSALKATAWVYAPYYLCRTLEVLQGKTELVIPREIPALLEKVYADREESGSFADMKNELLNGNKMLHLRGVRDMERLAHAQLATVFSDMTSDDETPATRLIEQPMAELLIVRSVTLDAQIEETVIELADETMVRLPWKKSRLELQTRKQAARRLAGSMVKMRADWAQSFEADASIVRRTFSNVLYTNADGSGFYVGVIQPGGAVETLSGEETPFRYFQTTGWERQEEKREDF